MRALFKLIVWLAGLAVVILVASKVLLEPTYTVSSEVVVKMPAAKIWAKVDTFTEWPTWVEGITRLEVAEGDGRAVGSVADLVVYNGFQGWPMKVQLVEVVPEQRIVYQVIGGPQHGVRSTITMAAADKEGRSVRVAWSESQTPEGVWGNLLASVMKLIVTTQHDQSLNNLKFHLERAI